MSGPTRECLRSMARACALLRLAVGSPLMARMRSPAPKRPSRLMEPPWMTLRISIPKPSLTVLTVIPAQGGRGIRTRSARQFPPPPPEFQPLLQTPHLKPQICMLARHERESWAKGTKISVSEAPHMKHGASIRGNKGGVFDEARGIKAAL